MTAVPALFVIGLIGAIVTLLALRRASRDRLRADGAIGALAIVALIGFAWATKECMEAGTCATPRVLSARAGFEMTPPRQITPIGPALEIPR